MLILPDSPPLALPRPRGLARWLGRPWPPGMFFSCCCKQQPAAPSSSGPSRVQTQCCTNSIPQNLTATVSSNCTSLNGLTIPLKYYPGGLPPGACCSSCLQSSIIPVWYGSLPASAAGNCMVDNAGNPVGLSCTLQCAYPPVGNFVGGIFGNSSATGTQGCMLNLCGSYYVSSYTCSPFVLNFPQLWGWWIGSTASATCCSACGCPAPNFNCNSEWAALTITE